MNSGGTWAAACALQQACVQPALALKACSPHAEVESTVALHRTSRPGAGQSEQMHMQPSPTQPSPHRVAPPLQGAASHALWQAWALMEQKQGDKARVSTLFQRGLAVSPRSRYTFLSWALWEKEQVRGVGGLLFRWVGVRTGGWGGELCC